MTTARRGISNHSMLESFERVHKHLLKLGFTRRDATRGATALTFALSGQFSREQVWAATAQIAPKQRTTGDVTSTDQP